MIRKEKKIRSREDAIDGMWRLSIHRFWVPYSQQHKKKAELLPLFDWSTNCQIWSQEFFFHCTPHQHLQCAYSQWRPSHWRSKLPGSTLCQCSRYYPTRWGLWGMEERKHPISADPDGKGTNVMPYMECLWIVAGVCSYQLVFIVWGCPSHRRSLEFPCLDRQLVWGEEVVVWVQLRQKLFNPGGCAVYQLPFSMRW